MNELENENNFDFNFDLNDIADAEFSPGEYEVKCIKSAPHKGKDSGRMMIRSSWRILSTGETFDTYYSIFDKNKDDPTQLSLGAKIGLKQISQFLDLIGRGVTHVNMEAIDSMVGGVCMAYISLQENKDPSKPKNKRISKFLESSKETDVPY